MVADSLVYHPSINHYIRFVNTTVGRDKLLRTLQYLARFLSFYLFRKGYSTKALAPWNALKSQFGMTRKLLRVGKNIEHLREAGRLAGTKNLDPVLRYTAIARQLSYFTYLTIDSIHYLSVSNIIPLPSLNPTLTRLSNKAWLSGISISLVSGFYSLTQLSARARTISKLSGEGKVEEKRIEKETFETKLQLLSDACDWVIPAYTLGIVGGKGRLNVDEGIVGLAGLVSSLVGVRAQWKKTAQ
ncbi:peroxisomal biogenesis factor 11 [Kalaharituber pfeilii]|nr:peroxisomal biogenesis factor 11 [Kalaharituber pfeilii]